jgi:hypothetical protein
VSDDAIRRLQAQLWALRQQVERRDLPGLAFVEAGEWYQSCQTSRLYSWPELALLIDRGIPVVILPAGSAPAPERRKDFDL